MHYYIRTTGERQLDESYARELGEDYTLLVDTEHKPVESFIEQLETISRSNAVLLEDDLILCKDFKKRIEEVIAKYPKDVINFFTSPKAFFMTREATVFSYNQCTYYPRWVAKKIATEMRAFEEKFPNKWQYDTLEGKAMQKLNLKHIQYRPCLVQHIDNSSLIQTNSGKRRTLFFIDYLEELGISYESCSSHSNQIRLKYLLLKKFK